MNTLSNLINADRHYLGSTITCKGSVLIGRIWVDEQGGPCVVLIAGGLVYDITASYQTVSSFLNDRSGWKLEPLMATHKVLYRVDDLISQARLTNPTTAQPTILAPCDLQVIKACGVTFAASLIERVIEEKAGGDPNQATAIRDQLGGQLDDDISTIKPGSDEAAALKAKLIEMDMWSQYLEVGIGPDAEVFTKAPVLSAVGHLSTIGVPRSSIWNNPEPEVVLAVNGDGRIVGATIGNDVNLRDVEGRSALLLGKAKDNNGSCAIGPFIRLFDDNFTLESLAQTTVEMTIHGADGYILKAQSDLSAMSRTLPDLVAQVINKNHQYPDGFMLFTGTMFAPTHDRNGDGTGFTHKLGDVVEISVPSLGKLVNSVSYCDLIRPWTFGIDDLMRNLAQRKLL